MEVAFKDYSAVDYQTEWEVIQSQVCSVSWNWRGEGREWGEEGGEKDQQDRLGEGGIQGLFSS